MVVKNTQQINYLPSVISFFPSCLVCKVQPYIRNPLRHQSVACCCLRMFKNLNKNCNLKKQKRLNTLLSHIEPCVQNMELIIYISLPEISTSDNLTFNAIFVCHTIPVSSCCSYQATASPPVLIRNSGQHELTAVCVVQSGSEFRDCEVADTAWSATSVYTKRSSVHVQHILDCVSQKRKINCILEGRVW